MCKTKTPNSVISSGSFIEDFDFVRSEVGTTRQEWPCEGGFTAVARWRAVGPSKVISVWLGVWCSVVGNANIVSWSKCWSIRRAAVDGISLITLLSCLIYNGRQKKLRQLTESSANCSISLILFEIRFMLRANPLPPFQCCTKKRQILETGNSTLRRGEGVVL